MAITRLVVVVILMINQVLIAKGWTPIPYEEEQIFEAVNAVAVAVATVWAWYKNNSVTKEAQEADEYLRELKNKKK